MFLQGRTNCIMLLTSHPSSSFPLLGYWTAQVGHLVGWLLGQCISPVFKGHDVKDFLLDTSTKQMFALKYTEVDTKLELDAKLSSDK